MNVCIYEAKNERRTSAIFVFVGNCLIQCLLRKLTQSDLMLNHTHNIPTIPSLQQYRYSGRETALSYQVFVCLEAPDSRISGYAIVYSNMCERRWKPAHETSQRPCGLDCFVSQNSICLRPSIRSQALGICGHLVFTRENPNYECYEHAMLKEHIENTKPYIHEFVNMLRFVTLIRSIESRRAKAPHFTSQTNLHAYK